LIQAVTLQQGICEKASEFKQPDGVYDCSIKCYLPYQPNTPLSSCPDPDLLTVLIKFRLLPVAFMADITKALLQTLIAEEDRGVLRFLWATGPD